MIPGARSNMAETETEWRYDQIGQGYEPRAPYAAHPALSRGRLINEPESRTRSAFQRDRDRIIHSNAFRRLKHKTQVFIAEEGDHYRTRLTHTLEVSQIARALARALRLDEELAETIALAHDFGHTPFGHTGEDALNEVMADYGGFDHNAQTLRIVTLLEHRYGGFDGLNLTWESLEGLVKHNGPVLGAHSDGRPPAPYIVEFNRQFDLDLADFAGAEAQCAAIADDIAYNAHDIDDGLRSGLINFNQLAGLELTEPLLEEIARIYPDLDAPRRAYELVRRQITGMVEDVIAEACARLGQLKPQSISDIYHADRPVVVFSSAMARQEKELKRFLYDNLYHHDRLLAGRARAEHILKDLFQYYMENTKALPEEWQHQAEKAGARGGDAAYARIIADFIAGMTDNYALERYSSLFGRAAGAVSRPV